LIPLPVKKDGFIADAFALAVHGAPFSLAFICMWPDDSGHIHCLILTPLNSYRPRAESGDYGAGKTFYYALLAHHHHHRLLL
jgi:hypothetical protein